MGPQTWGALTSNAGGNSSTGESYHAAPQLPTGVESAIGRSDVTHKPGVSHDYYIGSSSESVGGESYNIFSFSSAVSQYYTISNFYTQTRTVAGWLRYELNKYSVYFHVIDVVGTITDVMSAAFDPEGYLTNLNSALQLFNVAAIKLSGEFNYVTGLIQGHSSSDKFTIVKWVQVEQYINYKPYGSGFTYYSKYFI